MEDFGTAVQAAWTLTPESDNGVRVPLLDYALENKEALLKAEGFKLVIQQTPQFACDLIAQTPICKPTKWPVARKMSSVKKRNLDELLSIGL